MADGATAMHGRRPARQPSHCMGAYRERFQDRLAAWHPDLMPRLPKPAGPVPSRAQLHEAALQHLARFAATEAGLVRVLDRRVQRWARLAAAQGEDVEGAVAQARTEVRAIARALVGAGVVDDAAFATARASRLVRAGRSRRAVAAHLAAKGVAHDTVAEVLPDAAAELAAAVAFSRRRRIGPFGAAGQADGRERELGVLARAGFGRDVAERALAMPLDQADALLAALKQP